MTGNAISIILSGSAKDLAPAVSSFSSPSFSFATISARSRNGFGPLDHRRTRQLSDRFTALGERERSRRADPGTLQLTAGALGTGGTLVGGEGASRGEPSRPTSGSPTETAGDNSAPNSSESRRSFPTGTEAASGGETG